MEILNKYIFGSRLYGTQNENSDWDWVIVVSDQTIALAEQEYLKPEATGMLVYKNHESLNYNNKVFNMRHFTILFENTDTKVSHVIISKTHFVGMIKANVLWAYELAFSPLNVEHMMCPDFGKEMELLALNSINRDKLINSIHYETNFALSKAKAIFKSGTDIYRAQKNMFHANRFLVFGLQILQHGKITDLSAANCYLSKAIAKFDLRYSYGPNVKTYMELLAQIPKPKTKNTIVRVIPNWITSAYRFIDLRNYTMDMVVINRAETSYMARPIRESSRGAGITKQDLQTQGRISRRHLELLDYGPEFNLILFPTDHLAMHVAGDNKL